MHKILYIFSGKKVDFHKVSGNARKNQLIRIVLKNRPK